MSHDTVTFELNKVVRDGVLQDMLATGQQPEYRELEGEQKLREQLKKIQEEAKELDSDDPNCYTELQELQSAINAYLSLLGVTQDTFMTEVQALDAARGGFDNAYFVGRLTLRADDPWVEYYRSKPDRYPETA